MTSEQISPDQRYAAFRHRSFLSYWAARFLTTFATMIVSVAVGWQMYDLTRDPLDLGLVGIVQFLPALLLVLVTGVVADRFGRRLIMALAVLLEAICALALLILTLRGISGPLPIFIVLAMFGIARAFFGPASSSLFANLVPPRDFANAIAWNSSAWQTATIVGPVAGGLLYGVSAEVAYGTATALMLVAGLLIFTIPRPAQRSETDKPTMQTLFAGFGYIYHGGADRHGAGRRHRRRRRHRRCRPVGLPVPGAPKGAAPQWTKLTGHRIQVHRYRRAANLC